MIVPLLILLVFVAAAGLMFARVMPALLALPLMAIAIGVLEAVAGRLSAADVAAAIVADGAVRLAEPIVISFFGGMVSMLLQRTGIAERLVRRGAELAGDDPWIVSVLLMAVVALLFTTIGGLGAVIMVGTVVLPILLTLGLREHVAAAVLLFGMTLGGLLNANNWAVYRSVLQLTDVAVGSYAAVIFLFTACSALVFLTVELVRSRTVRVRNVIRSVGRLVILAGGLAVIGLALPHSISTAVLNLAKWLIAAGLVIAVVRSLVLFIGSRGDVPPQDVSPATAVIPLVPLFLILAYRMPFIPAFAAGLLYGIIVTLRRGSMNLTTRAMLEGSSSVMPAVLLMIGIGMLLSAILGPTRIGPAASWYTMSALPSDIGTGGAMLREWPVLTDMKPILEAIVPRSAIAYVVVFSLLGPLALYRGPLNLWGMGYGIGGILLATGMLPGSVMGVLMSLGIIQSVSDPTNTQNVWVANEVRIDVNAILWRTLPYSWSVAVLGLIAAGLIFY